MAFLATGCTKPPTEEEIQDEFADFVAQRNSCTETPECTLVYPDCPLGCGVAVRAEYAEAVAKKAKELVDAWSDGGQQCVYECMMLDVTCEAGRCALVPVE